MTVIDLSSLQKLNEGVYPNARLNEIVLEFNQDNPGDLKWLDTNFTIENHQVRDRFFVEGDERLDLLVESIKDVQGDLKLNDEIWSNMPCSVKLTQDIINGRKYWHTHDWKWDLKTYRQRILQLKQNDKLSQNVDQKSLLKNVKAKSKEPDNDLFANAFNKGSVQ